MKEFMQSAMVEMTCLSPVHIGNGKTLTAADYIFDRGILYIIQMPAFLRIVRQQGKIDAYKDWLLHGSTRQGYLLDWCKHNGLFGKVDQFSKAYQTNIDLRVDKGILNYIHSCMRLADGQVYIPGSSIKGAIRTAITRYLLEKSQNKNGKDSVQQAIVDFAYGKVRENQLNGKFVELENTLVFEKSDKDKPMYWLFSGIKVGDAIATEPVQTIFCKKIDVSENQVKQQLSSHNLPLCRECLPAGTVLKFPLTIDKSVLDILELTDIKDFLELVQDYTQNELNRQIDVLHQWHDQYLMGNEAEATIVLGGGPGFLSKTLIYELVSHPSIAVKLTEDLLNKKFKQRKRKSNTSLLAPKTIKVTDTEQGKQIMGLCKLEVASHA